MKMKNGNALYLLYRHLYGKNAGNALGAWRLIVMDIAAGNAADLGDSNAIIFCPWPS